MQSITKQRNYITTGIWKIPEIWRTPMVEDDSEAPMIAWTADCVEQVLLLLSPFIKAITARAEGSGKPHVSNIL